MFFKGIVLAADSKMKLLEESVALESISGKEYDESAAGLPLSALATVIMPFHAF